ncbi:Transcriptional regulator, Sir2 family [Giardia muris]|uniref:Transcriptional regulator, Sir2 family n=1 Tax=Giardia muris TaxID=5742 RepID=A0A4Z1TA99_GIAMU|nr:Transcriptional regulator, Sir2 family [Giardia muris]|eukprot:TNJ30147.1 Transcriptional regulator, Sir2 family [Giardia muris]
MVIQERSRLEKVTSTFRTLSTSLQLELLECFRDELGDFPKQGGSIPTGSLANLIDLAIAMRQGLQVVFITGAGLSVASGITPYRYSSKAIWSQFVTTSGERTSFKQDPDRYWNHFWLRTHEVPSFINALPNDGHMAITTILRLTSAVVVTQNIDRLHTKAGIEPERLVEIHGRLGVYKCVNQASANSKMSKQKSCPYSKHMVIRLHNLDEYAIEGTSLAAGNLRVKVPRCPGCFAPVMPHALMFDEQYVGHDFYGYYKAERWIRGARVLIFVGTSFSVNITQDAINIALEKGIRLFNFNVSRDIRMEETSYSIANEKLSRVGLRPHSTALDLQSILGPSEITLPLLSRILLELMGRGVARRWSRPRLVCYQNGTSDAPDEFIGSPALTI